MSVKSFIAKIFHGSTGAAVGEVTLTEVQHAVAALKETDIGSAVAADIHALTNASLTGAQKREQVVANTIPLIVTYATGGGISAVANDVEDIARELVQSTFNDVASTKAGAFATALLALLAKK